MYAVPKSVRTKMLARTDIFSKDVGKECLNVIAELVDTGGCLVDGRRY